MSNGRIFITPTPQSEGLPALKVRKPVNGHLAAEGEWVNPESYWLRRIKDGDVVKAEPSVESALPAAATSDSTKTRNK